MPPPDVTVIGSGPNGLVAALLCARTGLDVLIIEAQETLGGGARTAPWPANPGVTYDVCSAVHPLVAASPFFRGFLAQQPAFDLIVPEVSYAHLIDSGPAILAYRDLERTAVGLGRDGARWRKLFGPLVSERADVAAWVLGDHRSRPAPVSTGLRFARRLAMLGTRLGDGYFTDERTSALFHGVGAHGIGPSPSFANAGTALFLGALAHGAGWPILRGGSQAITDALVAELSRYGAQFRTGVSVTDAAQLPPSRGLVLDTSVPDAVRILGSRLSAGRRSQLQRFPAGHGAASKVDFLVSEDIPWRDPNVGAAGTVHLAGTVAQMRTAQRAVARGEMPPRPIMLLNEPARFDAGRIRGNLRPVWTYMHVPLGYRGDVSGLAQQAIERHAPGFSDTVVEVQSTSAMQMSAHNANYVAGDIAAGRVDAWRMLARPTPHPDPYTLSPGAVLCSAATPPGPGVHGMGGVHAAKRLLRDTFGINAPGV